MQDMEPTFAVIDMKSFYASCECAARGLDPFQAPLVVADPDRGPGTVVMSCTPFLKKKYHCPNVCRVRDLPPVPGMILAKPRMRYYLEESAKVVSIFLDFVSEEDLHVYSIDESFLRLDPYFSLYGLGPEGIVERIQNRIQKELGLIATAGIGPNMFLAKVCLDNEGKKNPPYRAHWNLKDIPTKLWTIKPITNIWGISDGISRHLDRLGIRSLFALAHANEAMLKKEFGIVGIQLKEMANGLDFSDIHETYTPKERNLSIGQTLMKDYSPSDALLVLREMNDDLCRRLRLQKAKASGISVFCRYKNGEGFSRQCSLDLATDDVDALYEVVKNVFLRYVGNAWIRGLGIGFHRLCFTSSVQRSLFSPPEGEKEKNNCGKPWMKSPHVMAKTPSYAPRPGPRDPPSEKGTNKLEDITHEIPNR